MLLGDKEGAPQIYSVATKLDQSKLAFNSAITMMRQSPLLSKHIRKRTSDLYCDKNMGYIKALASNSNGLDGLNTHMGLIDELAAIKNRDIYDLVKQSMGARSQPILFTITTNGFVRGSIFDAQYEYASKLLDGKLEITNKRFLPFIYELDDKKEWDKEECWIKANPGIGTIKSKDFLRQMVEKAKEDPTFKPTVMVKDFNMPENDLASWLRLEDIETPSMEGIKRNGFTYEDIENVFKLYGFKYGTVGFDYAETLDLAAIKFACMRPNDDNMYFLSMYFTCEGNMERLAKTKRDVYNLYTSWKYRGLLRVTDGNKINKRDIFEYIKSVQEDLDIYVFNGRYDRWHIDSNDEEYLRLNFGRDTFKKTAMGAKSLSIPMQEFKKDLQSNKIIYNNHPIDKWCLCNTVVKTDINGNIQPVKPGYGDREIRTDQDAKIDGTIAFILSYMALKDKYDEYKALIE